jgi:hypothetical protein
MVQECSHVVMTKSSLTKRQRSQTVDIMVARTNTVAMCTSKLQPSTGISLIPQVIYEHGPPWWNDINKGKLLIHPPVLSDNPTRRVI